MKSIRLMVWVLGALLVISSLDTSPDPPAVNPHGVKTKASCLGEDACGLPQQGRLNCAVSCSLTGLLQSWNAGPHAYEPKSAPDRIALSGHAADPSPPARLFLPKPSFRS